MIKLAPSSTVILRGKPGETKSSEITISSGLDRPLIIEPYRFSQSLEGKVSYSLEEVEKGKQYKVIFKNNPDVSGKYNGGLKFRTNFKERPIINIRIDSRFN